MNANQTPEARVPHETRPIRIWVDADLGVADLVEQLNEIAGVRTYASCQGSIGEGGPEPYGPYVHLSWPDFATLELLQEKYLVEIEGENWGLVRPRENTALAFTLAHKQKIAEVEEEITLVVKQINTPDPVPTLEGRRWHRILARLRDVRTKLRRGWRDAPGTEGEI